MSRNNELHRIPPVVMPPQPPPQQQFQLPLQRASNIDAGDMADNVKYIRWAAKIIKIIMVINLILEFVVFSAAFLGALLVSGQTISGGSSLGFTISITGFVGIFIKAFLTYTAARALELLADIAYHLLVTWHKQSTLNS